MKKLTFKPLEALLILALGLILSLFTDCANRSVLKNQNSGHGSKINSLNVTNLRMLRSYGK
jgi:hypothetical protein